MINGSTRSHQIGAMFPHRHSQKRSGIETVELALHRLDRILLLPELSPSWDVVVPFLYRSYAMMYVVGGRILDDNNGSGRVSITGWGLYMMSEMIVCG